MAVSIARTHDAWAGSTVTPNDGADDADAGGASGDADARTVALGDVCGPDVTRCDACVQPAVKHTSATVTDIEPRTDRTGSLLTCFPS